MNKVIRISLFLLISVSVALIVFLLLRHREKEVWATIAGLLAVVAATIAALPALRLLEIQEDATRPKPTPHFDLKSRYDLLQLRVTNLGAGVAYDIRLTWSDRPVTHKGVEATSLDHIAVLLPQQSVSTLLGVAGERVKAIGDRQFEGICSYKDSSGRTRKEKFVCSVDASQVQLLHDDEMPKTLRNIQEIPEQLSNISDQLERFIEVMNQSKNEPN